MHRDTRYAELNPASLSGGPRYISIRTFRRDGSSSACPVWAAEGDDRIFFRTFVTTVKARRLEHDPCLELAACDRTGRPVEVYVPGVAHQLRGRAAARAWWRLLRRQGPVLIFADLFYRRRLGPIVWYAIEAAPSPIDPRR